MLAVPFYDAVIQKRDPCSRFQHNHNVVVAARDHELRLCYCETTVEKFGVSLGILGVGKQKRGDMKTPLGEFSLGQSRRSNSRYHIFIPIQGIDPAVGIAIGIHGPSPMQKERVGDPYHDWTFGCIALPSKQEIEAVSKWVDDGRKLGEVHIYISE